MSRKSLIAILGVLFVFLKEQFGLAIDATAFVAILAYLLFESKLDAKRIYSQAGRFKDPKFWIALIAALVPVINAEFGFNLPADAIIIVLNLLLAILFKSAFNKA
jgi:uncharacterized membrane protein